MTYPYRTETPWAAWSCDEFGNDTVGHYIWEKRYYTRDFILGDGLNTSTFPTFTTFAPGVSYYVFDGVDDYLSAWPTMPAEYTVSAALSDGYPDGQPYISQCNDDTLKTLLTTPGAFTGNLHNIAVFDSELSAEEALAWADYQLRRLWRDAYINPYTARLIRAGVDVLEQVFTVSGDPYHDYTDRGYGKSQSGITWAEGLTYDTANSYAKIFYKADLQTDVVTVFASGIFDAGHVIDRGTNYEITVSYTAGAVTITANGVSSAAIDVDSLYSIGVVMTDGDYPLFYVNGRLVDTGGSTVTVDDTDVNDLYIGNQAGYGDAFTGTFKRLSIFNRVLTDAEMMTLHLAAMEDF